MKQWRKDGERLILCLDANENIYQGELGWQLTELNGLSMKEVAGEFTARPLGATYFRGSEPINGVWTTGNITMTNACVMLVGFGVGDHQLFVIDFATTTFVGSGTTTVVHPALRRLNTKIHGCADRYNKSLRRNILRHWLLERMVAAALSGASKSDMAQTLNKLDQDGEAYMKHVEKSPAGFPSLLKPRYGFASAKFTVLFCGGIMESYRTMATYAAPHGGAKSTPHFNSP